MDEFLSEKNTADSPQNTVQKNHEDYSTPAENVQPSNDNFDKLPSVDFRGISVDTYRKYQCSYNISSRRIIIPTVLPDGNKSYVAVLTNSKRQELDEKKVDYKKVLAEGGTRGIFNFDNISADTPVLIVEGEFDGLSIIEAGYKNVVAVGGQSVGNLIDWLNNNPAEYQFVVLFDNDDSGKKAAPKATDDLLRAGYKAVSNFISNDALKVDCNDILTAQGAGELKSRIDKIVDNAKVELQNVTFPTTKTPAEKSVSSYSSLPVDDIKRMLEKIPVESLSYDEWALTVGGGLVDWGKSINDLDTAFNLFNDFSARDTRPKKYSESGCMSQWNSLLKGIDKEKKRGIASLIELAKNYGYVLPQTEILKSLLNWAHDSHGKRTHIKGTQRNFDLIFSRDPLINGLIGYNEFFHQEVVMKNVDWRPNAAGTEWTDTDDAHLNQYLRNTYAEIKNKDTLHDTCIVFSRKHSFHPVKQYLESLHWDGTPRAAEFFIKFLKVEDSDYSRDVTLKWLMGAIARIYNEGCDFQFALVLQGNQGIGKGYCARMLGRDWHITLEDNLDDPHAIDDIQRGWIVEIEELAAARKSEINAVKSFLSRGVDTRRFAFERRAESRKRHCVFIITVNDSQFLRDYTGNRRFKILKCNNSTNNFVSGLTSDYVDQVWAEMFALYQQIFANGFNPALLRLKRENELLAENIATSYLVDDGMKGEIENFVDTKIPPPFIWEVFTKEERRSFIVNAHIDLDLQDINARIRAKFGKNRRAAQSQIDAVTDFIQFNNENGTIKISSADAKNEGGRFYRLYGTFDRESTCAAEIFNECFGNDKRKSMSRINEILTSLDGWSLDSQQAKNFAGSYGNQKKIYRRA